MRVPGAAPPPVRLAGGSETFGPRQLSARIAEGRRTTTFLCTPDGSPPYALRRVTDPSAIPELEAELGAEAHLVAAGEHGFVAPLVVGESLATVLDAFLEHERALPLPVALTIAMGIAARLDGRGRPHLDLVPKHVLLGFDGQVHIIDGAGPEGRGGAPGREGYRAPEQVEGEALDKTTDVFLLGVLLFEMTTGTRLFDPAAEDIDALVVQAQVPRPRDIVGDGYPIELQLVLRKLMRPSRAGRFPTPRAVQDALRLVATTRANVGPGPLAAWMRTELADRQSAWREVLGAEALLEPTVPLPVRPRAPSRAQTRPSSFLGATAPTIEELRLDSSTIAAVREKILEDAAASATGDDEAQAALREELAAMKRRRTELPAIPGSTTETTQPGAKLPSPSAEDTYEDLDVPSLTEESLPPHPLAPPRPRRGPKGLAASPPPTMVPELPTEVTRRFPPLPQPLGLEPADSDAATSLDELEATPGPVASIDMLGAPTPTLDPVPLDFSLGEGAEPGSLADLTPEALLAPTTDRGPAPTDLEPPPPTPAPTAAPDLSEDLVLDPLTAPTDSDRGAALAEQTDQGGPPAHEVTDQGDVPRPDTVPAPKPAPLAEDLAPLDDRDADDQEELGDTIQDDAPLDLLGPDDLAQLQRAVEVVPDAAFGVRPPEADRAPAPRANPTGAFFGSRGGASGVAEVAGPAVAPARPAARPAEPPSLGASPPPKSQAAIATQVVRDRIVPNSPAPITEDDAPLYREQPPLDADERELTPTPHLDLGPPPPAAPVEDEASSANLVIPISDDELEASERKRRHRWAAVLAFALAALVLATAVAWRFGLVDGLVPARAAQAVHAPPPPPRDAPAPRPEAEAAGADEAAPAPEPAADFEAAPEVVEPEDGAPPPEAEAAPPAEPEEDGEPTDDDAPPAATPTPRPSRRPAPTKAKRAARRTPPPQPAPPPAEPEAPAPSSWTLTVEVLPETATVEVEGQKVPNNAPIPLSAPGPVTLRVSKEGYETVTKTVARSGEVVEVHILLRKSP